MSKSYAQGGGANQYRGSLIFFPYDHPSYVIKLITDYMLKPNKKRCTIALY